MKGKKRNYTFVGDGGGRSWRRSRRPRARARWSWLLLENLVFVFALLWFDDEMPENLLPITSFLFFCFFASLASVCLYTCMKHLLNDVSVCFVCLLWAWFDVVAPYDEPSSEGFMILNIILILSCLWDALVGMCWIDSGLGFEVTGLEVLGFRLAYAGFRLDRLKGLGFRRL